MSINTRIYDRGVINTTLHPELSPYRKDKVRVTVHYSEDNEGIAETVMRDIQQILDKANPPT